MSSNHSRRSRAGPSHDDSPPENRQRPVQKLVQYIPEEHFSAWGERWTQAPPRRKSNKASTNSIPVVSVFKIEHGLYEFKLDSPPRTPLTPDNHAPSTPPVAHPHSGRPTKGKNTKRRTRRRAPYPVTSSLHQSQSTSARASTEERGLDTPTSGLFLTSLQAEYVATSSGGSLTPGSEVAFYDYPVPQVDDSRNLGFPAYNHYQHEVSAGSLTQRGSQILPYGASTIYHSQIPPFPDTTLRWTPSSGASVFPPIPPSYYRHSPDGHQSLDAMGCETFLKHDPRLPNLSEPYTQPLGQTLYQKQAYDIDAPDKHIPFPYNLEDTQS